MKSVSGVKKATVATASLSRTKTMIKEIARRLGHVILDEIYGTVSCGRVAREDVEC